MLLFLLNFFNLSRKVFFIHLLTFFITLFNIIHLQLVSLKSLHDFQYHILQNKTKQKQNSFLVFCDINEYVFLFLFVLVLQTGYWGRGAMDPEPGRCRRTDGKKWRCSRDVVAGQKYCERHMHRGRNRSRKHVELPTPTSAGAGSASFNASSTISSQPLVTSSMKSPFNLLHLNER